METPSRSTRRSLLTSFRAGQSILQQSNGTASETDKFAAYRELPPDRCGVETVVGGSKYDDPMEAMMQNSPSAMTGGTSDRLFMLDVAMLEVAETWGFGCLR